MRKKLFFWQTLIHCFRNINVTDNDNTKFDNKTNEIIELKQRISQLENQFEVLQYRVSNLKDLLHKFDFMTFQQINDNDNTGLLYCKYCCRDPSPFTKNDILNGKMIDSNVTKTQLHKITQSVSRHQRNPSHVTTVESFKSYATSKDIKIISLHLKAVYSLVKSKQSAILFFFYFIFFAFFFIIFFFCVFIYFFFFFFFKQSNENISHDL